MNSRTRLARAAAPFAVATSVCASVGYYGPPSATTATVAGVCAALLFLAGGVGAAPSASAALGLAAAGAVAAALAESARLPAAFFATAASLVWLLRPAPALRGRLSAAAVVAGGALLGGRWIAEAWPHVELREFGGFDVAAQFAAWGVEAAGGAASADGPTLALRLGGFGATTLRFDWFKCGGLFLAIAGAVDAAAAAREGGLRFALRRAAVWGALAAAYATARLVATTLLHAHFEPLAPVLDDGLRLLTFAPLAALSAALLPRAPQAPATGTSGLSGPAALVLGALLAVFAAGYYDVGSPRRGAVLLDAAHSRWEETDRAFDETHWGRASTYNYAALADLLRRAFDYREHREGPLDARALAGVQTLILKTPTRPYAPEEEAAIAAFAEEGGGVWLVGDHTNLYGMSDVLNRIARRAGLRFRPDAVYDARSGWTTFADGRRPRHPTTAASGALAYQTSCSVEMSGLGVEPALVAWRATGEDADYGNPNFFGNMTTDLRDRTGILLQGAVGRIGRGRVAVFTDSTILSNFALYDDGVSELALRTVAWLGAAERLPRGWREATAAAAVALLAVGAARVARRSAAGAAAALCLATAAAAPALAALEARALRIGEPPPLARPHRVVGFVEDASTLDRTSFIEEAQTSGTAGRQRAERSLSTLRTWVLRLKDCRPASVARATDLARGGLSVAAIVEPRRPPTAADLAAVGAFVAGGGVLFVADDLLNRRESAANAWLAPFGLSLENGYVEGGLHAAEPGVEGALAARMPLLASVETAANALRVPLPTPGARLGAVRTPGRLAVRGGVPLLADAQGVVIAASTPAGRGAAVAFSRSSTLTNAALGTRFDPTPDAEGMERHRGALALLKRVVDADFVDEVRR